MSCRPPFSLQAAKNSTNTVSAMARFSLKLIVTSFVINLQVMVLIHFCMLKYSKFKTLNIFILLLSCHSHFMYFKRICSSCDRQIVIMYYFTYMTVLNNNLQYKKIILLVNFNVVLYSSLAFYKSDLTGCRSPNVL